MVRNTLSTFLGAVIFVSVPGCDGIVNPNYEGTPHWMIGSAELPSGIELTLSAPDEVKKGEEVPISLTIRNTTDWDIELRYREYRKNFAAADAVTDELAWSSQMLNPVVLLYVSPLITLKAGEEITYEENWDLTYGEFQDKYKPGSQDFRRDEDEIGKQVSTGTYMLYGSVYFGIKNHQNENDYHTEPHYLTVTD
jgi:hypothetical protein